MDSKTTEYITEATMSKEERAKIKFDPEVRDPHACCVCGTRLCCASCQLVKGNNGLYFHVHENVPKDDLCWGCRHG